MLALGLKWRYSKQEFVTKNTQSPIINCIITILPANFPTGLPKKAFVFLFSAGFILFLSLMIDRLHQYIIELRLRRKTMEAVKKNDVKCAGPEEIKAREQQVETFKAMIRQLESDLESKVKEASTSEATVQRKYKSRVIANEHKMNTRL